MRSAIPHVLMFLPMFLAVGLLAVAGAGTAALVLALVCGLMMVVMLVMVVRDGSSDR